MIYILFDGNCSLCSRTVQFVLLHSNPKKFKFGSLHSTKVKHLLSNFGYIQNNLSTLVVINNNQILTESTGVLQIIKEMKNGWSLLYVFIIIPKVIRDYLYKIIANNRHKIFKNKKTCNFSKPEWKNSFID